MASAPLSYRPRPYTAKQYKQRSCKECLTPFNPRRHDQLFCSSECRKIEGNRELTRAKAVYRLVYHWANNRKLSTLLTEIAQTGRHWGEEDRSLGLPPPPLPHEGGYSTRDRLTERLANAERRRAKAIITKDTNLRETTHG